MKKIALGILLTLLLLSLGCSSIRSSEKGRDTDTTTHYRSVRYL